MAIDQQIRYAPIERLFLDPANPRLGRRMASSSLSQEQVLDMMRDWTLDELATSFLENGFWPQEALIVVEERLYEKRELVVVEGNRRLAALRYLKEAIEGNPVSRKWRELAATCKCPENLFSKIPYILAESRDDVTAFLGFRHVTGIKPWRPTEKAQYIARLIDDNGMDYAEVMRKIGSKTDPVRRNYISYRILLQLEDIEDEDGISLEHIEQKFSVLFLSLRETGVQRFLEIDIRAKPEDARTPVPQEKLEDLASFATWLFGTKSRPPLFTDSRNVGKFSKVLESRIAVEYLKTSESPNFELAVQKSGADEPEIVRRVQQATDEIEQALGRVHLHLDSPDVQKAVLRFGLGALELLNKFPEIRNKILSEGN